MADYAHNETDRELEKLEKRIAEIYKDASDSMKAEVDSYFESFEKRDAEQKKKLDAGDITQSEYNQWRLTQIGRGERYKDMQEKLAERYTDANEVAVSYVNDATPGIYSLNRNYEAYTIGAETGLLDADFSLYDESAVRRLIVEQPDLMPNYPERRAVARGIDLAYGREQITASITSGILQGNTLKQISNNLQARISAMNRVSAVRTARTAFTCAQNAGRQDALDEAEDMGIEMEKMWLATLDESTRPEHAEADGQRVSVKDDFTVGGEHMEYPGDRRGSAWNVYNCRCTMVSIPKGMDTGSADRWARDIESGTKTLVPDMSYDQWYEWRTEGNTMSYEDYQRSLNGS